MSELLDYFKSRQEPILNLLTQLVEYESFTPEKENVDRLADFIIDTISMMEPASVTRIPRETVGDIVIGKWNEDAPDKPLLFLMHIDTVWKSGTLARRPIHVDDDGRMFGPGIFDMKAGVAIAISAVQGLLDRDEMPDSPIWLMFTTDEEVGSNQSEDLIREYAEQAGLVLVMEPATQEGSIKTARKGIATYDIEVEGRAAHAGNHPEEGLNAILELAQQIIAISKLQDLRNGISVATNVISGGDARNIIAPSARAELEVRTFTLHDMDRIHEEIMSIQPKIPGTQIKVFAHRRRAPMERNTMMASNFAQCQQIASSIGINVTEDTVGGGSDGNFISEMGIPVLDGLGARGAGLHAEHEHIIVRSLPERTAHIAAILRDWSFTE